MLNPALAAASGTGSVRRNFMYSLIWRSVTWRPGNRRILREEEPIPSPNHRDRQTAHPLRDHALAAVAPQGGRSPTGGATAAILILIAAPFSS